MSVVAAQPISASVRSVTDLAPMVLPRNAFLDAPRVVPSLAVAVPRLPDAPFRRRAGVLGSGPVYSAFTVAFNLPNLIRAIVADNAISAAFVPVFLELRERGEEREAWRVAGMVIWTTAVVLGAISALFILLAPVFVPILMVGTTNVSSDLVVSLTRLLFPIVVLM